MSGALLSFSAMAVSVRALAATLGVMEILALRAETAIAENDSNAPLIQSTTRTMFCGATRCSFGGVGAQDWIRGGEP